MAVNRTENKTGFFTARDIAVIAIIAAIAIAFTFGYLSVENSKAEALKAAESIEVVVHQGDTLWGIAEKYQPDGYTMDEFMHEVNHRNAFGERGLKPGDRVSIPVMDA